MTRLLGICLIIIGFINIASGQKKHVVAFNIKLLNYSKDVDTFYLAGSFNQWNPKDPKFQLIMNIHRPVQYKFELVQGMHEFKFTKGSWEAVECGKSGMSIENRKFNLFADTLLNFSIESFNCQSNNKKSTKSAQVIIANNISTLSYLSSDRRLWIYLPKDYHLSKKKYPVLYMQDGQNLFDEATSGYGEWSIDEYLDSLNFKNSKSFIIVGIDHKGRERVNEYHPYDSKFGKGYGDQYLAFLTHQLKPYIDSHYHTLTDKKHTFIAGSSMGGLISLYAIAKHPDTFGAAAIFSPSFWIAPEFKDFVRKKNLKKARIYIAAGANESKDMVYDIMQMKAALEESGVKSKNLNITIDEHGTHSESYWREAFQVFYKWLMKD